MEERTDIFATDLAVYRVQDDLLGQEIPCVAIPKDHDLRSLESCMGNPAMLRQFLDFGNIESFTKYINERKSAATRMFWAMGMELPAFLCCLDYHAKKPSWNTHNVKLVLELTEEAKAFRDGARRGFSQKGFMCFLEDWGQFFTKPTGGEMMDMIRDLRATKTVQFNGVTDLDSGDVEIGFSQKNKAERGSVQMPSRMTATYPVVKGGVDQEIEYRVQYQACEDRGLVVSMEMLREEYIRRQIIEDAVGQIVDITEVEMFELSSTGSFGNLEDLAVGCDKARF